MFYFLSELSGQFSVFNIFRYITFRAGMASVTTFFLCLFLGPYFINCLKALKVREVTKRKDCPGLDQFQEAKEGTPTMGGIFVIGSIVVSVLLWANLTNRYILLTLVTCVFLALLGFVDDYVKLTQAHKGRRGLNKKSKLIWQLVLGFFIGSYVYFNPDTDTHLAFPFFKDLVINMGVFYAPFVAMIIIGSSNAVNLTDGLDGLAIGCVLVVSVTLAGLCYIVGNFQFAEYLFIPFVSGAGELTVFCAAIVGASLGFLWFNCYPATIFMGDTGALSLGGTLGVIAIFIKNELLLALVGGIFVLEAVSVILQVLSFRLTGRRIFKMAPFHHHLQLSGWKESKIIVRFWILAIVLAFLALTTLKIR